MERRERRANEKERIQVCKGRRCHAEKEWMEQVMHKVTRGASVACQDVYGPGPRITAWEDGLRGRDGKGERGCTDVEEQRTDSLWFGLVCRWIDMQWEERRPWRPLQGETIDFAGNFPPAF